jgi:hypothetical protein
MSRNFFGPAFRHLIPKYTSTASIDNYANAGSMGIVSGNIYVNVSGSPVLLSDFISSGTVTSNVGAAGTNVTAAETGNGVFHRTVLTLTAVAMTVADATAGGGALIYTFPAGIISILGGSFSVAPTTTSTIASTLKSGVTVEVGVGTESAGAGALTTTEENIIVGATGPSSTVINVAAAAILGIGTTPITYDGHTTPMPAYLNLGVPTGTDIDADATVTFTGTVTLIWAFGGDV